MGHAVEGGCLSTPVLRGMTVCRCLLSVIFFFMIRVKYTVVFPFQMSAWGIFINHTACYFLSQILSLNVELTNLSRLADQ